MQSSQSVLTNGQLEYEKTVVALRIECEEIAIRNAGAQVVTVVGIHGMSNASWRGANTLSLNETPDVILSQGNLWKQEC